MGQVSDAPARDFLNFVNASPSPFHATSEIERRVKAEGYQKLEERDAWSISTLKPNGKYYMVRNQSAIVAFAVGGKYQPGTGGFTIAAAHTDSPNLRVKPVSTLTKGAGGYLSVGVETYGGGLWYTWLDRDLSVAGRAVVAKPGGGFESRLVRIDRPILKIPSLAIHLNREVNTQGLKLNAEDHLAPILCSTAKAELEGSNAAVKSSGPEIAGTGDATTRHHPLLVNILAKELSVRPGDIYDFDLSLYDTQPAAIGGALEEHIYSPRLDNLMMSYVSFEAFVQANKAAENPLEGDSSIRIAAAFDHEECGSDSVPGAGSSFLEDLLKRLCPDPALQPVVSRKSFLVSADMAHALHPNYAGLHEENHRPHMHKGVVVKCNSNQRYATTNITSFIFRQLALEAKTPVQSFVVRQDMGCGSTIGPIVATRLGFRTVDVGIAQLSMHSIREMCGVDDVTHALSLLKHYYGRFPSLDASIDNAD